VGWVVAAYAALGRFLPGDFRSRFLDDAVRDLRDTLRAGHARRGWPGVVTAGTAALADMMRRIPVEWWKALRGTGENRGRSGHPGTGEWMMTLWNDLRIAARALARRPAYAMAALVTLALGIGATVAIFTVVNDVVIRSLPYPDADRVVVIEHHAPGLSLPNLENSAGTLNLYWKRADFLQSLAAYDQQQRNLLGGPHPDRVEVVAVTPQLFQVLGAHPSVGRAFTADDAAQGAAPVGILTHAAWVTRFGADPGVVGRTVQVDDATTEIVGVMPEGFAFPDPDAALLTPLYVDPNGTFGTFGTAAVARLAPGVTLEQAQARIQQLQSGISEMFPDITPDFLKQAGWGATVERLQDKVVGAKIASALWIVLATVGFVLLIACANVANLFLVRAESRQKELALRAAMGAGRGHIASGFLGEALLLGGVGGALGLLLAWGGIHLLVSNGPAALPRLHEISVDGTSLLFAGLVSLVSSLALGAIPLVRYSGVRLASILRDGGRASTDGRERHRTRSVLVTAQLALALVLLVGSGLMLRSFDRLRSVDPGFDPHDVLTVGMSLGDGVENTEAAAFYQRVADEVAALPGVQKVGISSAIPVGGGNHNGGSFYIDDKPRDESQLPPVAMYKAVGADYLAALRLPLLEGRDLTRTDWNGGEPVALVNKAFEDQFLDGKAVGRGVRWDTAGAFARVVGVVGNVREQGLQEDVRPWAYLPMVEAGWAYPHLSRMYLFIRSDPGTAPPVTAIRDIVGRLNASVPLTTVRTMDQVMARSMAETSFTMVLLAIATGVALFLGAVGLFGVISYVVSQRTREIGVRAALGARREDIRRMVFRESAGVAVAGVALGLVAAYGLTRLMGAVLFDVSATDPVSFVAAPVLLVAVTVTATWLPARRASRVDPMEALRAE